MMAGGDLDGDIFFVCWNPDIVEPIQQVDPANYSSELPQNDFPLKKAKLLDDKRKTAYLTRLIYPLELTIKERQISFFLRYVSDNELGLICTTWEVFCDNLGAMDPRCRLLAQGAAHAVDAAKSGLPVSLPPWANTYNGKIPHWSYAKAKKNPHKTYK
jgi:RNA-dependent RNA polymerase